RWQDPRRAELRPAPRGSCHRSALALRAPGLFPWSSSPPPKPEDRPIDCRRPSGGVAGESRGSRGDLDFDALRYAHSAFVFNGWQYTTTPDREMESPVGFTWASFVAQRLGGMDAAGQFFF